MTGDTMIIDVKDSALVRLAALVLKSLDTSNMPEVYRKLIAEANAEYYSLPERDQQAIHDAQYKIYDVVARPNGIFRVGKT